MNQIIINKNVIYFGTMPDELNRIRVQYPETMKNLELIEFLEKLIVELKKN